MHLVGEGARDGVSEKPIMAAEFRLQALLADILNSESPAAC